MRSDNAGSVRIARLSSVTYEVDWPSYTSAEPMSSPNQLTQVKVSLSVTSTSSCLCSLAGVSRALPFSAEDRGVDDPDDSTVRGVLRGKRREKSGRSIGRSGMGLSGGTPLLVSRYQAPRALPTHYRTS